LAIKKGNLESIKYQVWKIVSLIPPGKVTTYGAIAKLAGVPGHARWVGYLLRNLPEDTRLPWHRVVGAVGKTRRSNKGGSVQYRKLEKEGVHLQNGRIDLQRYGWQLH